MMGEQVTEILELYDKTIEDVAEVIAEHLTVAESTFLRWYAEQFKIQFENNLKKCGRTEEKNCGLCKHYNLDGMFGIWCSIHEIPTHDAEHCSDYERG